VAVKQLRQALTAIGTPIKQPAERRTPRAKAAAHVAPRSIETGDSATAQTPDSRSDLRARALALARGEPLSRETTGHTHGGEAHWAYEGENGPQAWSRLKPEFSLCNSGKRQSPIAIQSDATLQGPAEAVQFHYTPGNGTVINDGHTIQVDLEGNNSITVRNSTYKLQEFHFHTPSEEMINDKRYAMVAHLVHKSDAGQLAVVSVLMEQGEPSSFIDKVWTYMPLDTNDRVHMPDGLLDMNEILPADQRYYQFMGSLTTPPCTEGVLWMVIKQPLRISPAQFKLFSQQFPFNARPVQAGNGRVVREAQ
jgi:carbonic anhydrase